MFSKLLLIAICVAVNIDISCCSGDDIDIIECNSSAEFVQVTETFDWSHCRILPILVTKNEKPEVDRVLLNFYKSVHIPIAIKLRVDSGSGFLVDNYLQRQDKRYPSIYLLLDGNLVNGVARTAWDVHPLWLNALNENKKYNSKMHEIIKRLISLPMNQSRDVYKNIGSSKSPTQVGLPPRPPRPPRPSKSQLGSSSIKRPGSSRDDDPSPKTDDPSPKTDDPSPKTDDSSPKKSKQ